MNKSVYFLVCLSFLAKVALSRWSIEKAELWSIKEGWRVGCNFIPSTAINQLEMWQQDTYDRQTIDRELNWASSRLAFNTVRVFLHYIAWGQDRSGFLNRMGDFLSIASQYSIKPMFVFFDDCWNSDPQAGTQPDPIPGVHNSGWVQCPGNSPESLYGGWDVYVTDILQNFGNDDRILMWDLYNEPGNSGHQNSTLPRLENVFKWARNANPDQPITSGQWTDAGWSKDINQFLVDNSDIITFHSYCDANCLNNNIDALKGHLRPIICTEYMARTAGSTFQNNLPVFKDKNIGAINWGLVFGQTNTVFPWGSPQNAPIPATWFHDIFWNNSTAFSESEVEFVKNLITQTSQDVKQNFLQNE